MLYFDYFSLLVFGTTYGGSWHFRNKWLVLFSSLCGQLDLELLFPITATKPQEQSFCEVFCGIKMGVGNVLTVSKVFLGQCGSSSLEKKHFLKESTNYFSLPQLMPLCQCFYQVKTSGHLFYVEDILVSARQIFPLS